jgi:hypothetical protein
MGGSPAILVPCFLFLFSLAYLFSPKPRMRTKNSTYKAPDWIRDTGYIDLVGWLGRGNGTEWNGFWVSRLGLGVGTSIFIQLVFVSICVFFYLFLASKQASEQASGMYSF